MHKERVPNSVWRALYLMITNTDWPITHMHYNQVLQSYICMYTYTCITTVYRILEALVSDSVEIHVPIRDGWGHPGESNVLIVEVSDLQILWHGRH